MCTLPDEDGKNINIHTVNIKARKPKEKLKARWSLLLIQIWVLHYMQNFLKKKRDLIKCDIKKLKL